MFGHLKARDFVNLMEGIDLPSRLRSHVDTCARCRANWQSLESLHAEVNSMEDEIPEPDWAQFRSSVRDRLLSRSIHRETAVRRWTGWAIRPGMAWALSLLLVVGLTTVAVVWHSGQTATPSGSFEALAPEPAVETFEPGPETSLFDDLVRLGGEEP